MEPRTWGSTPRALPLAPAHLLSAAGHPPLPPRKPAEARGHPGLCSEPFKGCNSLQKRRAHTNALSGFLDDE